MASASSPAPGPVQPTRAEEDALLALLRLELAAGGDAALATGEVARALGVAAPTATVALQRLARLGLVDHQPYHGVRLTPDGRRLGGLVLRRHRLIETFLVRTLDVPWTEVHEEAARLEHGVSPALLERIDAHLGHPASDPHGDPIPDAEGRIAAGAERPLPSFAPGAVLELVRILGHDPATFTWLARRGLAPGVRLRLDGSEPAAGTVAVTGPGEVGVVMAAALAGRLLCLPR